MRRREQGFALILVIWALVLLASVATGFAYAVRHETRAAGDLASLAQAEAAGEAALRYAVLALGAKDREQAWTADAQPREFSWSGASVTVRVRSESSRIDLNSSPRELLVGLFEQRLPDSDAGSLADAVVDWRDTDDRTESGGSEKIAYAAAGYRYGPANRPFHSVNELSQVMGFGDADIAAVTPYLTVHSHWARLHAASADPVTLSAVPGIDHATAEAFVQQREQALAAGKPLDFQALGDGAKYLETRGSSRVYALEIRVRLDDGATLKERCVIQLGSARGFTILTRDRLAAPETTDLGNDDAA